MLSAYDEFAIMVNNHKQKEELDHKQNKFITGRAAD